MINQKMVKFKMKIFFVLGVSVFTTITMILYVTSFSGFDIFNSNISRSNNVVKHFENSSRDKVSWQHFVRNPKNPSELVDLNLSTQYFSHSKTYKNEKNSENLKYNSSIRSSPMYNMMFNGKTQLNESYFNSNNIIRIHEGAIKDKNIEHLFQNKSIYKYFKKRRNLMIDQCSKVYNKSSVLFVKREKLEHILVDEKNKVLFCYIPKVACTNWKRMFMLLTGKSDNYSYVINLPSYEIHSRSLFASLQNYTKNEIDFFIQNYTKVIFVRNPLERLLSAYRNKLEQHYNSSKYFQARFGKYIIKNYRSTPNSISLLKGDDVTFTEFVSYLVSSSKDEFNEHWQTMNELCHPCFLKYDLIGQYDTLISDAKYLLDIFNIKYPFPLLPKPSKTASALNVYYKQLSYKLFQQLLLIYDLDFKLFNFSTNLDVPS